MLKWAVITAMLIIAIGTANATIVEDFEATADWNQSGNNGGTDTIQDANAITGKAFKITTDAANDSQYWRAFKILNDINIVGFYIRQQGTLKDQTEIGLVNSLEGISRLAAIYGTSKVINNATTETLNNPMILDTWYYLEFRIWGKNRYDFALYNEDQELIESKPGMTTENAVNWDQNIGISFFVQDAEPTEIILYADQVQDTSIQSNIDFNTSTQGTVAYETGTDSQGRTGYRFIDVNSILVNHQEMPIGKVYISFNHDYQQWEFDNDQETRQDANILILPDTNLNEYTARFRDLGGGYIEDAEMQIEVIDLNTGEWKLIGKKITNATGTITFHTRSEDIIKLTAIKDGYETGTKTVYASDYEGTGDEIVITTGQTTDIETQWEFTAFPPGRYVPKATDANIYFHGTEEFTVCYNEYQDTIIQGTWDTTNCFTDTDSNYTINITTIDVNYYLIITVDGNIAAKYYYLYKTTELDYTWVFPTPTTNEETINYFLTLFIILIIISSIAEATINKGLETFFTGTILFAFAIPIAGLYFVPAAICGAIYLLSTWAKDYWSG